LIGFISELEEKVVPLFNLLQRQKYSSLALILYMNHYILCMNKTVTQLFGVLH